MDTGRRDVLMKGQKIGEGSAMRWPTLVETLVDDDNNDGGGGDDDDAVHLMISRYFFTSNLTYHCCCCCCCCCCSFSHIWHTLLFLHETE